MGAVNSGGEQWRGWGLTGPLLDFDDAMQAIVRWGLCHVIGKANGIVPSLWRSASTPGWDTIGPWVNGLAEQRLAFSAKVIRQPGLVSLELLPSVLGVVVPASLDEEYRAGRLDREGFVAAEAAYDVLEGCVLDTREVGSAAGLGPAATRLGLETLERYGLVARAGVRTANWVVNVWGRTDDLFPQQYAEGVRMDPGEGMGRVMGACRRWTASGPDALVRALGWRQFLHRIGNINRFVCQQEGILVDHGE